LRAAGVWEATGTGLKAWQRVAGTPVVNAAKTLRFVVNPPREVLYARIDARLDAMMEAGALSEVRSLVGLDPALSAARALGVRQLLSHLAGKTGLEEAVAAAKTETRRYAKRQMAWFRRFMKDWIWLEDKESCNIIAEMKEKLP
ncbi:MAG: tRNA (adenosine(37)-N6)-dimethylallyltransferase MiaA, partial [Proteobacteria bacterium]|nr:tRNA (adenosine(37)-N6)-dimethylallyltransferase MiaA [Pseudomonadota bacterium]